MDLHLIDGPLKGEVVKNFVQDALCVTFSTIQDPPKATFVNEDTVFELDPDCPYPRLKTPALSQVTYKVSEGDGIYIGEVVTQ